VVVEKESRRRTRVFIRFQTERGDEARL